MTLSTLCERDNHWLCNEDDCTCESCHLVCPTCHKRCKRLFGDGQRCAACERELAARTPFKGYPCDDCGTLGAFRNPIGRKNVYRCTACHVKSGEELKLPGSVGQKVMAACAHEPFEHPAHEFIKVRGARYRCQRCHQDAFTGQGGIKLSALNVVGEVRHA